MRLVTHEWGSGGRTALLVHGMMSDLRSWRRVGPALADRGYRVVAVDLRGHGASPRAARYAPALFADDLVETLPSGAELALGHSLGALALSLAADRLRPARAVYSEPAWGGGIDPTVLAQLTALRRDQIAFLNPRWDPEDLDVEVATLARWDPAGARYLEGLRDTGFLPARPVVPSLVQRAGSSGLVGPDDVELLTGRGFEVRTVEGTGHCIHRDDFDAFMASLAGWV